MNKYERYFELLEAANNAETKFDHDLATARINGFFDGLESVGMARNLIFEGDNYYLSKGIDRQMCGGLFLDWTEKEPTA